jgi:hypothetical protein
MNLDVADDLIKPFLNHFHKCEGTLKPLKEQHGATNKIYQQIFDDLSKNKINNVLKPSFLKKALRPNMFTSSNIYFPEHIQHYIQDYEDGQYVFTQKVAADRVFTLYISRFTDENNDAAATKDTYTVLAQKMFSWLAICQKYSLRQCATNLNIFLYPTPFKKELPDSKLETLGPDHVNTALTKACVADSEILIYRKEEMFKVFIHESFHSFGLDLGEQPDVCKALQEMYPIASTFNAAEGYAEMWARIMNCAYTAFHNCQNQFADFCLYLNFCLQLERIFAIYQCHKVLAFMGLTYDNLHKDSNLAKSYYSEDTNVFAYYVLTAIFFSDVDGFLGWCLTNNTNLYQFNRTPATCQALITFIKQHYKGAYMRKRLALGQVTPKVAKTTRMSVI